MEPEELQNLLNTILKKEQFNNIQEAVFLRSWQGLTYPEIAEEIGYDTEYIKHVGFQVWQLLSQALNTKVSKNNFRAVINRYVSSLKDQEQNVKTSNLPLEPSRFNQAYKSSAGNIVSWGEANNVTNFYGRQQEIALLEQWIINEQCCMVAILGMGGIGKTSLSVKLVQQLQTKYDYVIWRSLRNAPVITDLLMDVLTVISNSLLAEQERESSWAYLNQSPEKLLAELLEHLRRFRCLLVLDNVESILMSGDHTGTYREGYDYYGELFRRVGEVPHQSCLVLTSREKPSEVSVLEGTHLPVRSLNLSGLSGDDAKAVIETTGLVGNETEVSQLIDCYRGNPLALRIASNSIHELFDNEIAAFLREGTFVSSGIRQLLNQQFQRLTHLEKQVMYWLAISREWVTVSEIKSDLVPSIPAQNLLETLQSLVRRSLIEQKAGSFTQQPVVMEYTTEVLIAQVCQEIAGDINNSQIWQLMPLFKSHALLQADAEDRIREAQVQLIVKPLIDELTYKLGTRRQLEIRLEQILETQRSPTPITEDMERPPLEKGYVAGNVLNLLNEMGSDLTGWDFSELTISQAYLPKAYLHHVDFTNSDLSRSVFTETFGSILSVSFSPDGKLLATGEANGEIYLWRVADSQLLNVLSGHKGWVWSVAFSPDGRTLASGCADRTIRLWDVASGQELNVLQGHTGSIWSVSFSPDGKTLVSGSHDRTIRFWDVIAGDNTKTIPAHHDWVWSVAFSPDSQMLASSSTDKTIKLWDVVSTRQLATLEVHSDAVCALAFSPDGQTLASGSCDRTIKLIDVKSKTVTTTLSGHTSRVTSLAFSRDGQLIASASLDCTVRVWQIGSDEHEQMKILQGHTNSVWSVAFSPQENVLVSGSADQTIRFWLAQSGQNLRKIYGYSNPFCTVAFSPDGKILASGSADGNVRLWDVATGKKLKTLKGHSNSVRSVAFSPDGQILASGSHDRTIKLWNIGSNTTIKTLKGHSSSVWSVAFSPDGQMLASGSQDCTIRLWQVSSGQLLDTLEGHTNSVCAVAWGQDSHTIASGSDDCTIRVWDVSIRENIKTLEGHGSWVWAIAFSPDRKTLASGSLDQTVRLWDVDSGEMLRIWEEHTQLVRSVAFSPDGSILASGSDDQKVRLWAIDESNDSQAKPRHLEGHSNWIWSVAFSPDGEILATSSEDETIKLWSIKDEQCLHTLRAECPYEGMNITGATGISDVLRSTLKTLGAIESF